LLPPRILGRLAIVAWKTRLPASGPRDQTVIYLTQKATRAKSGSAPVRIKVKRAMITEILLIFPSGDLGMNFRLLRSPVVSSNFGRQIQKVPL
jgi:hypothetical protein